MEHLRKHFVTNFGSPEFYFSRLFTATGVRFHLQVQDTNQRYSFFNMELKVNKSIIAEAHKVPAPILNLEGQLSDTIMGNEPFERRL